MLFRIALFQLVIWTGPFLVGDMDWPLSGWGMNLPLSSSGYGLAPF